MENRLSICEKDRIKVRDLIVTALVGIPTETLQRITEQVMDLPGYSRDTNSRDTTITDQAFQDALTSVVRETAQEWATKHREQIRAAVLRALDKRQNDILTSLTENVNT